MAKKVKRRKNRIMGLAIFGIIMGVLLIVVGSLGVRWSIHKRTVPGYGDYVFDGGATPFNLDLFPSLVIDENATQLKVMQISDPQIKFGAFPNRDRKTFALLEKAIKTEKPDICIVTGDLTCSVFTYDAYKYFAEFMQKMDVKWGCVYGNHDSQFDCSKYTICNLLKNYSNCLFSRGPGDIYGECNYLINVYKGSKKAENLAYSLVLMDSNMYPETVGASLTNWIYDRIHQDQVDWYCWAMEGLKNINPDVKSTMFFHIPVKEFADLYYANLYANGEAIPAEIDVSTFKEISNVTGNVCESNKKEKELVDAGYVAGIFYQGHGRDTDLKDIFTAVKEMGCTSSIFCGHDHANTLKGYYDGIYLGYGRCSGYHTYPFFNKFPSSKVVFNGSLWVDGEGNQLQKGVTIIEIDLDANYGALTATDKDVSYFNK